MVAVAVVAKSGNQTSFQSESLHRVRAVSVWALDTAKPVTSSGPERKKGRRRKERNKCGIVYDL